jgi:hypothetical protein
MKVTADGGDEGPEVKRTGRRRCEPATQGLGPRAGAGRVHRRGTGELELTVVPIAILLLGQFAALLRFD